MSKPYNKFSAIVNISFKKGTNEMKIACRSTSPNSVVEISDSDDNNDSITYNPVRKTKWEHCEFCDKTFKNRYDIIKHNASHIIIPLIKQDIHQCQQCLHHFTSPQDLAIHTTNKHTTQNPVKLKEIPKILESIVNKQAYVKCEDELKELVKYQVDNKQVLGRKIPRKDPSPEYIVPHRVSSPTDEEKESIRHRLLFEEDVEDGLLHDLTTDCQVSVEQLDRGINGTDITINECDKLIKSHHKPINAHHKPINANLMAINSHHKLINSHHNPINSHHNPINANHMPRNSHHKPINSHHNPINSHHNPINSHHNPKNPLDSSLNGHNTVFDENSSSSDIIWCDFDGKKKSNIEKESTEVLDYGKAIHYDVLTATETCICQWCDREFPNRFMLLKHEPEHMRLKRSRPMLCCVCERYIAGNYRNLRRHMANTHPDVPEKQHTIQKCKKCSLKYYNYATHLRNYHSLFKCQICQHGFETSKILRDHHCDSSTLPTDSCDVSTDSYTKNGLPTDSYNKSYLSTDSYNKKCVSTDSCNRNGVSTDSLKVNYEFRFTKSSVMKLCEMCFSFMKIYIQNRQNYEEIGELSEIGVRQTCDKCNNKFFEVKLLKRKRLVKDEFKPRKKGVSNKDRLSKIQNRLKMMKIRNKF